MTAKQAFKEAKRRWGQNAMVRENKHPKCHPNCRYAVGKVMLGMFFEVRGEGATWEAAFEKANSFDAHIYGLPRKQ